MRLVLPILYHSQHFLIWYGYSEEEHTMFRTPSPPMGPSKEANLFKGNAYGQIPSAVA
uniref:Uncharacterized protein n=1 Tax=Anguilla anguilla TaxID=7936 RepID=A0A0E9TCV1_ANGAN